MSQKKRKLIRKVNRIVERTGDNDTEVSNGLLQILRENWKILVLIMVGVFIVNFNGLNANFVSDDYASITQNTSIKDPKVMLKSFNSTSYSIYLQAALFGTGSPIPYHAFNYLLLMVILVLVYLVVYKLFGSLMALITTSIFAVLPIHVEAVTWISGRPYMFIALYVLAAFLMFIRFVETDKKIFLILSILLFIAGFLTDNPRPFSLFLIIVLYLVSFREKFISKYTKYLPLVLVVAGICLAIAWPYINYRIQVVNSGYNSSESIFYDPFFQYPTGLSKYFQLLLYPIDLTLYHTMYVFPVWLNWLILLTYLTMIVYFFFKDKKYFFAFTFFLAAILPSILPVKVSWLVAERYSFLASLGFCIFLALIFEDLYFRQKKLAIGILVVMLSIFGVRTYLRNIDWQTNHKLWVNTCQVSPNSHNAWNNIGDDYDKLKQFDNAIKGFTQSTVIKPNYADAFHNRANILFKIGRLDLARDSYMTALYFSPSLYQTYLSLINIDLMERKLGLALEHSQKVVQLQPNDPTSNFVLAVVLAERGEIQQAKVILENILKIYPDFKQAKDALVQLNKSKT